MPPEGTPAQADVPVAAPVPAPELLRRRRFSERASLGFWLLMRRTLVAWAWTLPVCIVMGLLAVLPAGLLVYVEHDRFADRMVEISGIAAARPAHPEPLEFDGGSITEALGARHDVFDADHARRLARDRMSTALRLGFVLTWGVAFFFGQAALTPVVQRGLTDGWSLAHLRHAPSGLRRGWRSAVVLASAFTIGFGGTIFWFGPVAAVWLPTVALAMVFVTWFVAVGARAVESDSLLACMRRSAELTRGHRVGLFLFWAAVAANHLPWLFALSIRVPSGPLDAPLDAPHARQIGIAVLATGAVFPTVCALLASVAYHRLRQLRDAPTKLESMADAFA